MCLMTISLLFLLFYCLATPITPTGFTLSHILRRVGTSCNANGELAVLLLGSQYSCRESFKDRRRLTNGTASDQRRAQISQAFTLGPSRSKTHWDHGASSDLLRWTTHTERTLGPIRASFPDRATASAPTSWMACFLA